MGAGQSTSSEEFPSRALHVLRVTPSSPASETDIEPFFDFVTGFEGDSFTLHRSVDVSELERIVESHEERTLNLLVWNSKSKDTRVVPIVPSRAWSETGVNREPSSETKPSLLGLSMRMCEPEFSLENVWHVLDVLEGSPAESAGLVPYGDWIIGWSGGVLSAENDFYDVVEAHVDRPLRVYVYSHDFDTIREVVLVPNRQWGGEGLLGCVFGFGLLHRIPEQPEDKEPGMLPPELIEGSDEYEEQTLFVPADAHAPLSGSDQAPPNGPDSSSAGHTASSEHNYRDQDPDPESDAESEPTHTLSPPLGAHMNRISPSNRSLSAYVNGVGVGIPGYSLRTSPRPWEPSITSSGAEETGTVTLSRGEGKEGEVEKDDSVSVSGTETTQEDYEDTSQGSPTSID